MHTLPEAFSLASGCGLWTPVDWKSSIARALYRVYTYFNVTVMLLLMLSELIALVLLTENINDFAEASYVFLAGFNGLVKGFTFLYRRKHIADLARVLRTKECTPRNVEESQLIGYYDKMSRYTVLSYASLVGMSSSSTATWPAFFAEEKYTLQLKAWYPYTITSDLIYWCTYVHQGLGIVIGAAWNTTNDTIIAGFMMQTCAQLDLLSFRLKRLPDKARAALARSLSSREVWMLEKSAIRESVRHHLQIFRFARDVQSTFAPCILVQFCLSIIILCITIYELTVKSANSAPISFMLIFLTSMFVELFLYCWFGNEVTLKSLEFSKAVCDSDWTALHADTLKGLLIMMVRTTSPILITCGPFITLSLTSYTGIIKLSYSAFNVLQTSN